MRTDRHRGAGVTVTASALGLLMRGVLGVAIIAAGLVVGAQLRASREQLAAGQAASAASAGVTARPSPKQTVTPAPKPSPSPPAATKVMRTLVPTPTTTPFTGVMSVVRGTVTMGGTPVRGAQVMVYPSNSMNHGPTPVPPESGKAMTDDRGVYQVSLPPGIYRIGAYRSYNTPIDPPDGFSPFTWYGDGYMIGLAKDLVVSGSASGVDIAILRYVSVAGRVVGRDGVGVPNAQVSLSRPFGGIQFPLSGGTTDGAGRFSLFVVPSTMTLAVQAAGRTSAGWTTIDLDLRADRTDLIATIDRGNIVSGTLRDAAGRPLPNTNFGVTPTDDQIGCVSCNARTDGAGHFSITLPSTTVRFRNWAQPGAPELLSLDYAIFGDLTLDPVLQSR